MISVVIVNYFCHKLTARAALSVLEDDPTAQIIIVDNSNNQLEADELKTYLPDKIELIVTTINLGFGRACNLAFEQALGESILLLNPDAYVLPGCLQQLLNTLQSDVTIGAVSPIAQWDEDGLFLLPPAQMQSPCWEWIQALGLRLPFLGRWLSERFKRYALQSLSANKPIPQNMLSGAHMLLRRSAIEAINGLFDPSFFMYYEDTDLSRRLSLAGFMLILDPKAKAVHQWRNDPQKSLYVTESRFRYMHKYFSNIQLIDKLRHKFEQHFTQQTMPFQDLGVQVNTPTFDLASNQKGTWLFELSPSPLLIPAAYHSSSNAPNNIPLSIWSLLGPAHYWARITPPNGRSSYFTWEIPTPTPKMETPPSKQIKNISQARQIDWAHPSDETDLLKCFLTAFEHEMPPALWRWKYQGLDTLGTLMRDNSKVVAFYGGMSRPIHLFGTPESALQIGDVMVHPKYRGTLSRKGPFFQVATQFLERYVGEQQRYPIAFGFPSARAYQLSVHLGLYDKVGELMQVSWPALQVRSSYKVRLRPLSDNKGPTIDRLWRKMAKALKQQVVGVRDWNYINHRYLQHPTVDYKLYQVSSRFTGITLGIMILRILDDKIELVDVIAQPRHISILVHCLRRLTESLGKSEAYTWITLQNCSLFTADVGDISPTGIVIPHNRWTKGIPASELLDRWWLMAGDTDFR
jgi:GT2 family glycosyltransferase